MTTHTKCQLQYICSGNGTGNGGAHVSVNNAFWALHLQAILFEICLILVKLQIRNKPHLAHTDINVDIQEKKKHSQKPTTQCLCHDLI